MRARNHLKYISFALLLLLFLCSAYMMFATVRENSKRKREFEALADLVNAPSVQTASVTRLEPTESADYPEPDAAEPVVLEQYAALYEKNPDLFGWIRLDGTDLNYPVMHTPDDPEHYLRRAFDGSYSLSGVPFLDGDCTATCGNLLIHGHNMKDGSMFAPLLAYAQADFWREHPTIHLDTLYEAGEYDVVAAFYSKEYEPSAQGAFRYYRYVDVSRPEWFHEYMEQVYAAALYPTGVTAEYGDSLFTLSTCSYHAENGRFVVVARKSRT